MASVTARVRLVAEPIDANLGYVTLDNPSRQFGEAAKLSFGQRLYSAFTPAILIVGSTHAPLKLNCVPFF